MFRLSSLNLLLCVLLSLLRIALELQGGRFDHADRLFFSIPRTWELASATGGLSDVKELIPEFYYLPQFLENRNRFDFDTTQRGQRVNDVMLPPWACGSPQVWIVGKCVSPHAQNGFQAQFKRMVKTLRTFKLE